MSISTEFEPTEGGLVLTNAILLYQAETRSTPYPSRPTPAFASIHPVERDQGGPVIGAGSPLSRAQLRQWTEALGRTEVPEILPDNVLVSHADMLAWWVPAMIRTTYFALTDPPKGLDALAQRTIMQLPYPAHVFIATRGRLGVYALATSQRPCTSTVLRHSPVLNVFVDGSLCWGNIPVPKSLTPASMPEFERAVFDSWSTHPNPGQEHTVTGRGGLLRLWHDLVTSEATRFPVARLKSFVPRVNGKPTGEPLTLGALVKRNARA